MLGNSSWFANLSPQDNKNNISNLNVKILEFYAGSKN